VVCPIANTEVNEITSRHADTLAEGCPSEGMTKIWVFYADSGYCDGKSWGVFRVDWSVDSRGVFSLGPVRDTGEHGFPPGRIWLP
jgi:hypothetical protein